MAEEFQAAEVCGGAWWSSPRTTFNNSPFIGSYGGCWQNEYTNMNTNTNTNTNMNMKARSTDESSAAISPDSAFQIADSSPSTTTNWNQALLVNETTEDQGFNQTLTSFGMNQEQTSNYMTNSGDCTGNLVSTTYGYPTSLLQNLFDCSSPPPPPPVPPPQQHQHHQQQQQTLYDFQPNLPDIESVSNMSTFSSLIKPKPQILGGLHLANKTPFWNTSTVDLNDNRASFLASTQSRFLSSMYGEKPIKSQSKEIRDLGSSMKKSSGETTFKRPRLETPSPLPTFKVRKEKLGDRVTALQQLVSPFGKTDTASVLHEAIEYIKLLHDQVNVLSAPYMKSGPTMQGQQVNDQMKDNREGAMQQDLRSRGLCLVPVSSTFPGATETAPDYWTSSFGTTFK